LFFILIERIDQPIQIPFGLFKILDAVFGPTPEDVFDYLPMQVSILIRWSTIDSRLDNKDRFRW
jgi:hypothetical protein